MKQYISILRPSVCVLSMLGIFAGSLITHALFEAPLLVFFAILAAFFITGSGDILNDYFDYEIDRINAPHRPIPSGKISRKSALVYAIIINLIGLVFAVMVSPDFLLIALINTSVLSLYAWKLKRYAFIGNVSVSYLSTSTFIASGLITGNFASLWSSPIFILALISFFGTLGREIFKDIEDVKGDKKIGAKTLPIIWGENPSKLLGYAFLYIACLLLFLPLYLNIFGFSYMIGIIPALVLCLYAWKTPPAKTQRLIKLSMYLVLVGFVMGSTVKII